MKMSSRIGALTHSPALSSQVPSVSRRVHYQFCRDVTHSAIHGYRLGIQCLRQSTLMKAMRVQMVVVTNAAGCIACAWLANACYSLGNIFSGKPLHDQSREELVIANSVWAMVTFCSIIFVARLVPMLSLRFLEAPDRHPTVWFCLKKLAPKTLSFFITAVSVTFTFGYLMVYLSHTAPVILAYRLECYAANFSLLGYFTGIAIATKNIFYQETSQGHERVCANTLIAVEISLNPTTTTCNVNRDYRPPTFWREYVKNLPKGAPPIVATVFVHILSRLRIIDRGAFVLGCFIVGSTLFKLAIQENAKHYVLRKRVRSTRVMCVLVGVPTVLIDTQTRIVLLGTNSMKASAVGALGMAFVEICLRVGKALYLMWSIRRHQSKIQPQESITPTEQIHPKATGSLKRKDSIRTSSLLGFLSRRPSLTLKDEYEMWCLQVQAFHTAELNADMYAEYIAIGCSSSILFFYGSHPHYSLLRQLDSLDTEVSVMEWRLSQFYILLFQVGVEFVVDYISIVLEMMVGIEYKHVKPLRSFLAAFFMVTAVMNINVTVGVYLN